MQTAEQTDHLTNGIDTNRVGELVRNLSQDQAYADFRFRAANQWQGGSRSCTAIQGFYAGRQENTGRQQALTVDADQPEFLVGENSAPNAVEHYLHALTSCLSTTLVYHAAVRGISLEDLQVSAEGRMNARGFFGISDEVNRGYNSIQVEMRVKSAADVETLTKLAMYSPVYEMVSRAVPVEFRMTVE